MTSWLVQSCILKIKKYKVKIYKVKTCSLDLLSLLPNPWVLKVLRDLLSLLLSLQSPEVISNYSCLKMQRRLFWGRFFSSLNLHDAPNLHTPALNSDFWTENIWVWRWSFWFSRTSWSLSFSSLNLMISLSALLTVTKNLINLDNNKITKITRIFEGLERKKNPWHIIL